MDININNISQKSVDEIREQIFGLIHSHIELTDLNSQQLLYLLGYYSSTYAYVAELYSRMIQEVRTQIELGDRFSQGRARDRRDVLEQGLKAVKMEYDSLSRKVTVLLEISKRNEHV